MQYFEQTPPEDLVPIVKSFWQIENPYSSERIQDKIVPDGYPELIFHFGDPYKTNISGTWELQDKILLAGQLKNYFFLENTGAIGMFAIKFQPWVPSTLFELEMKNLQDKVLSMQNSDHGLIKHVSNALKSSSDFNSNCREVSEWLINTTDHNDYEGDMIQVVKNIIETNGKTSISNLVKSYNISERALERYFSKNIGLSPKFYSRVIRLACVFKLVQENSNNWAQLSYLGGFYDQAHFIKDFKKFTGEEPTKYGFSEKNMANFFLKR